MTLIPFIYFMLFYKGFAEKDVVVLQYVPAFGLEVKFHYGSSRFMGHVRLSHYLS